MNPGPLARAAGSSGSQQPDAVPEAHEIVDRHWRMLIGGQLVDAASVATLDVVNPADETLVARFPQADESDVDAAVSAARAAAPDWAATSITDRAQVLKALADTIETHGEELAWIDTIDNGSRSR